MRKLIIFLFAFLLTTYGLANCFADERVYLVSPQGELIYATDRILRTSTTGVPASLGTVVLGTGNSIVGRSYAIDASNSIVNVSRVGSSLYSGQNQNVSSAAAVQISGTQAITSIALRTPSTNMDYIYVGPSGVTKNTGYAIATSETLQLNVDQQTDVWVIAGDAGGTAANKISYVATVQ